MEFLEKLFKNLNVFHVMPTGEACETINKFICACQSFKRELRNLKKNIDFSLCNGKAMENYLEKTYLFLTKSNQLLGSSCWVYRDSIVNSSF